MNAAFSRFGLTDNNMNSMRLDKWLWAARFYKTRKLAVEAINGGHVHLDGQRCKPAQLIKPGSQLEITRQGLKYVVEVQQLSPHRGPASVATTLYGEDPASVRQREQELALRRQQHSTKPQRKPDKRQRRKIIRFINKYKQPET